jgi:excisionase family DNA binding protein
MTIVGGAGMEKIFDLREASHWIRISESTLRRIIKSGDLQTVRLGSRLLIRESALISLLDKRREAR